MKKILAILLALAMIFAFAACGSKNEEEQPAEDIPIADVPLIPGVPNPRTEFESLEALNGEFGLNLAGPGAMGVTDEVFASIDCGDYKMAEYKFSIGGHDYCLRCAPALEDISGLWIDEKGTIFSSVADGEEAIVAAGGYHAARWFNIDGQYCFTAADGDGMTDEFFEGLVEEMKMVNAPLSTVHDYASLIGDYQDSFSQRASMTVTEAEDAEGVKLLIHWGSSASEADFWDLEAAFAEDGLLYYSGEHSTIFFNEDGSEKETVSKGSENGYFSLDEAGNLCWNGAFDESCADCVFEKMQ